MYIGLVKNIVNTMCTNLQNEMTCWGCDNQVADKCGISKPGVSNPAPGELPSRRLLLQHTGL